MNSFDNNSSASKYTLILNTINDKKYKSFFDELDNLLMKKRFDNAYELSLTENILCTRTLDLTAKEICKVIDEFLNLVIDKDFNDKRALYEVVKISNLPSKKFEHALSEEKLLALGRMLKDVSRETTFISYDFLILRILDNFSIKINNSTVCNLFNELKKEIWKKLLSFDYESEKKEKETTFLCWIDRLTNALMNRELRPEDFVFLCHKIFYLTAKNFYTYWKILNSANYALLQQDFSANEKLREFKRYILKKIDIDSNAMNLDFTEIRDLMISTLAKKNPNKEDFYYLFNSLSKTSLKSDDYKLFCINLCLYLLYYNSKQNIFCYRFIRNNYFNMLSGLISEADNAEIKDKELQLFIILFHIDSFFSHNKYDIFKLILNILRTINDGETKLTHNNFYKYCDMLDYIMASNADIYYPNLVNFICPDKHNFSRVAKRFNLSISNKGKL